MKLFEFFKKKDHKSLDKKYSLKTEENKPFKFMEESQLHQVIEISKESNMIGGNIAEHLCSQLVNARRMLEQTVEHKDSPKSLRKIIDDIEQFV